MNGVISLDLENLTNIARKMLHEEFRQKSKQKYCKFSVQLGHGHVVKGLTWLVRIKAGHNLNETTRLRIL